MQSQSHAARCALLIASTWVVFAGNAAEYAVSPRGDDTAAGTKEAPWRTLGHACEIAAPGDTVLLREGVYRETLTPKRSGEAGRPIRFHAAPGEKIVISGTEPLVGAWSPYRGSIYALKTDRKFIQLFADGKMMPEARWPNSPADDLMGYRRAVTGKGTGYETLSDTNLPAGNWKGGIVLMWPGDSWVSDTRRIADYRPGQSLRFDHTTKPTRPDPYHAIDPYAPREGNNYVLMGSLDGLDAPGEWFLDEAAGTVYLWTIDGAAPEKHAVEIKQRDLACDLSKLGFIEIKGLEILGAAVSMRAAHDCRLDDCRLRYVEHYRDCEREKVPPALNVVTGTNNEWNRCLVAYGATTALNISGVSNRFINCVLHDANYLGTGRGGLDLGGSVAAQVRHCTLSRSGRDMVGHGGSKKLRFEYNDMFYANLLNSDAAAIYCYGTDGEGGIIAYNWVHDNVGDHTVGIYLDNFSKNFFVHHNVVWNNSSVDINLNSDALNHLICNNTVSQSARPFGTYAHRGYTPTMKGTRIINNLVNEKLQLKNPHMFVQGELGPEIHHNGQGALDREGYPTVDSKAIDAGVIVPGITDGFQGKAPDLGAYEFGGPRWTAGADWRDPDAVTAPPKNLQHQPQPPITDATMIKNGLVLWLDTQAQTTLDRAPDGTVLAWRDRSASGLVAKPTYTNGAPKFVADGLQGKPVIRSFGRARLLISGLRRGPGAVTALIVSQGLDATGPSWGRLIQCSTGQNQPWELPNWEILRPDGKQPTPYPGQVFSVQQNFKAALADITLLGAAADIAEVLVFDRALRFDEQEALEQYLKTKWDLHDQEK